MIIYIFFSLFCIYEIRGMQYTWNLDYGKKWKKECNKKKIVKYGYLHVITFSYLILKNCEIFIRFYYVSLSFSLSLEHLVKEFIRGTNTIQK